LFLVHVIYFGRPSATHFLIFFPISNASLSLLGGGVSNNSAKSSMSSVLIPSKGSDGGSLVSGSATGSGSTTGSGVGSATGSGVGSGSAIGSGVVLVQLLVLVLVLVQLVDVILFLFQGKNLEFFQLVLFLFRMF